MNKNIEILKNKESIKNVVKEIISEEMRRGNIRRDFFAKR